LSPLRERPDKLGLIEHLWGQEMKTQCVEEPKLRIPIQSGHRFRFDPGHRTDLMPAAIPK